MKINATWDRDVVLAERATEVFRTAGLAETVAFEAAESQPSALYLRVSGSQVEPSEHDVVFRQGPKYPHTIKERV